MLNNLAAFLTNAYAAPIPTPGDVRLWTVPEVTAVVRGIGFVVDQVAVESDYRGPDGDVLDDEEHARYSIWLTIRKPSSSTPTGLADPPR